MQISRYMSMLHEHAVDQNLSPQEANNASEKRFDYLGTTPTN